MRINYLPVLSCAAPSCEDPRIKVLGSGTTTPYSFRDRDIVPDGFGCLFIPLEKWLLSTLTLQVSGYLAMSMQDSPSDDTVSEVCSCCVLQP
ncbi:hypothetical protein IG631_05738 [Alternaria alternata]|nr:hypothetical protein IG631_05738 [Alternaria alternata]